MLHDPQPIRNHTPCDTSARWNNRSHATTTFLSGRKLFKIIAKRLLAEPYHPHHGLSIPVLDVCPAGQPPYKRCSTPSALSLHCR